MKARKRMLFSASCHCRRSRVDGSEAICMSKCAELPLLSTDPVLRPGCISQAHPSYLQESLKAHQTPPPSLSEAQVVVWNVV